jgi:uncharacterized protein with PQ loop repeat
VLHHLKRKGKRKDTLDWVLYFFAFTTPLFEIPQAYWIYKNRTADGVSPITWGYFVLADLAWITYGIKRKMGPIVFTYIIYLLIESSVVVGVMIYK